MELQPALETLAQQISQRRGDNPFLLFLGVGVANAAGVPSTAVIARAILGPQDSAQQDEAQLIQAFYQYLEKLSRFARQSTLQQFYSSIPVPRFYQDLAILIDHGYFQQILTTGVDTLLEQALEGIGKRRGIDYQVTSFFGAARGASRKVAVQPETPTPIRIVKLHGDLSQSNMAITPGEIADVLLPNRYAVKGALHGDLVMVGYQFESPPVTEFLTWSGGEIWWVSPKRPPPDQIRLQLEHEMHFLTGTNAEPQTFFGLLNIVLSRLRTSNEIEMLQAALPEDEKASLIMPARPRAVASLESAQAVALSSYSSLPSGPQLEEQYLRGQLQQCQANLSRLEQQISSTGEKNVEVQIQIDYQRHQIAQLEDQLRALTYPADVVIDLVREVANAVRRQSNDPGAISFMRKQVNTLTDEYARTPPSQEVIGAAIGATILLAERLGKEVVDDELVRRLLPLAPSTARRWI